LRAFPLFVNHILISHQTYSITSAAGGCILVARLDVCHILYRHRGKDAPKAAGGETFKFSPSQGGIGWEFEFLLLSMSLVLLFIGACSITLDHLVGL
jgi:hypothetical protein